MQYYLRVHYLIHSRNFNPDYATKVNINNFTKMLTGIAYKFSKQKFMTIWMGIGERFWDMVSDNSDITDCSGI
ncbi:MAG: hypothetical protein IJ190_06135 [Prevotella sp.]|nr:hypothetical protein [Prevotella sp.]